MVLILHPAIASYRVDFFNSLYDNLNVRIILSRDYLYSQPQMTIDTLSNELNFKPQFLKAKGCVRRCIEIWKELRRQDYKLVIVSECGILSITTLAYKLICRRKTKVVSVIDDSYDMAVNGNQLGWKHKISERLCIPFFDDIICVDPRVTSHFQSKYGKGVTFPIIQDDKKERAKYLM